MDFSTNSGYPLDRFEAKVHDALNQGGTMLADWTLVQGSIGAGFYGTNWALPSSVFTAMKEGVNYVSVRVYDSSPTPNSATLNDAFYVRKDTTAPRSRPKPADGAFSHGGRPSTGRRLRSGGGRITACHCDRFHHHNGSSPLRSLASFTGLAENPITGRSRRTAPGTIPLIPPRAISLWT